MHQRHNWLRYSLIALALVLSSGWTGAVAQDKPRSGGELLFVVPSEPPSYDAHEEETFGVIHPMAPHYSTLLKVDPFDKTGTKPVGDLAESWTISKDGTGLHVQAPSRGEVPRRQRHDVQGREGLLRQDHLPARGREVAAQGRLRARSRWWRRRTPYTVRFRLKWPESSFLLNLASPWNWIYKADILAKDMHWYEKNVDGDRSLHLRRARQGLALGRQEEPGLLGQGQALPRRLPGDLHELVLGRRWRRSGASARTSSSAASARPSATASSRRWATRSRCRRAPGTA